MNDSEISKKIKELYLDVLERVPDIEGLRNSLIGIKNSTLSFDKLRRYLLSSEEFATLNEKKEKIEKHRGVIKKPIFIVGVPRTGTTMLYRIMCQHPELAWFSHLDLKYWFSPKEQEDLKRRYTKLKEEGKPVPRNEGSLFVFGTNQGTPLPGTDRVPTEAGTFWYKFVGNDTKVSVDNKLKIYESIANAITSMGRQRFLNKSPQNSVRLFLLKELFPDAKFINCIRDPRPVVSSMMERDEKEGEFDPGIPVKNKSELNKMEPAQKWAWYYKTITDAIYDFAVQQDETNFLTVIYEDFQEHPYENLRKILKFCEIKQLPNLKEIVPPMRKKALSKWREKINPEDEKKIFEMTMPAIKKMNYPYSL